jgi:hypothetical protein
VESVIVSLDPSTMCFATPKTPQSVRKSRNLQALHRMSKRPWRSSRMSATVSAFRKMDLVVSRMASEMHHRINAERSEEEPDAWERALRPARMSSQHRLNSDSFKVSPPLPGWAAC